MENNIKIDDPCSEKWDDMKEFSQGRFCEICSKNVFDFTEHTDGEIQNFLKNQNGAKICGRISLRSISKAGIGLVLIANLSFVQAQNTPDISSNRIEKSLKKVIKVSGKLILEETQQEIPYAEVFFISKKKIIKTVSNKKGDFSLEIPDDLLKDKNVLYLDFRKLNGANRKETKTLDTVDAYDYQNEAIVFSRNERIVNKKYVINHKGYEIGAVVIIRNPPPNYYYFNGKNISESKYNKLKEEFPHYTSFSFEDSIAKVISGEDLITKLYLLYSN
ncbi:hypothetical protein EG347_01780 [Chryseobacterium sp. G0186]|uniref:hypothetical protein n=1 Tax=Chryseobacterium sp. G0186 TaxID=2487064 RepID=UPI000F50D487|nr:hypothetical protein [Chryseobacterium sp. G0186]AZA76344.1 hypothetical protein EG347_01780 [Chryseobacterium sp. G0186]